jgi:hypothetical protein
MTQEDYGPDRRRLSPIIARDEIQSDSFSRLLGGTGGLLLLLVWALAVILLVLWKSPTDPLSMASPQQRSEASGRR